MFLYVLIVFYYLFNNGGVEGEVYKYVIMYYIYTTTCFECSQTWLHISLPQHFEKAKIPRLYPVSVNLEYVERRQYFQFLR